MTGIDKNLRDFTSKPKYSYVAIFSGNWIEKNSPLFKILLRLEYQSLESVIQSD